jgi:hypothetical protein
MDNVSREADFYGVGVSKRVMSYELWVMNGNITHNS